MSDSSVLASFNSSFAVILRGLLARSPRTGEKTTYKTIAEYLGVKQQSVSSWANGTTIPDTKHIAPIAVFFGASCDYLLGLTDVISPDVNTQEVNKRYGLSEKAQIMLEWLSAPYNAPDNLHDILERQVMFQAALHTDILPWVPVEGEPHTLTLPRSLTKEEFATFTAYLQVEANKDNLKIINRFLSSYKGLEVLNSISLYMETKADEKIEFNLHDDTSLKIGKKAVLAQAITEAVNEFAKEGENNA